MNYNKNLIGIFKIHIVLTSDEFNSKTYVHSQSEVRKIIFPLFHRVRRIDRTNNTPTRKQYTSELHCFFPAHIFFIRQPNKTEIQSRRESAPLCLLHISILNNSAWLPFRTIIHATRFSNPNRSLDEKASFFFSVFSAEA